MESRLNSSCLDLISNFYSQLLLGSYVYFANPEANWGSASQAQTILTAMNATQVASSHMCCMCLVVTKPITSGDHRHPGPREELPSKVVGAVRQPRTQVDTSRSKKYSSTFPSNRPSLMDFANIITKKISILIAGHVITEEGPVRHKAILEHTLLPSIQTFIPSCR